MAVLSAARLGFNFQSGSVVYGIEGDWDWAGIKGTSSNATVDDQWLSGCFALQL